MPDKCANIVGAYVHRNHREELYRRAQRRQAVRAVTWWAADAPDLARLLEMLGLTAEEGRA